MPIPALRVIEGGLSSGQPNTEKIADTAIIDRAENASTQTRDTPAISVPKTPRPWRMLVVLTLRYGQWLPPLWLLHSALRVLRSWSIRRAMQTMKSELGWDGSEDFNFIAAFIRVEGERRNDPTFRTACERALHIGRITVLGFPVILNEEIDGRGQGAFIRHFGWTVSKKLTDPIPWWMKP